MSCFLCFICHNTVHSDTNAETREKYKDLIGMKLCQDAHLCHICCHLLKKLWLFKSICLRRSMEYPILFNERGAINLHNSQIENIVLCPNTEECEQATNTTFHFTSETDNIDNQYVSLEDNADYTEPEKDTNNDNISETDNQYDNYDEKDEEVDETKEETTTESKVKEETKSDFYKVVLSIEEQKAELERKRRDDKYLEAEFKCYNCAMAFLFKDTYQAHMMRHEESNGEHLCPICLLRFASACVLRAHTQAHRERYECTRCGVQVRPRRRQAHKARCSNTSQAICHLCSKTFSDGNALQQHIKRFHLSKTSRKTYSCHVCGSTHNNRAAVRTHMLKHINKKFSCPQCPARFSSPYTLAAHSKRHGARPPQCAPCRLVYTSEKGLRAHLKQSQAHQDQILVCQLCSKTCATQRSLTSHMQTVHSTDKPFCCGLCGARYTSKKSLGAHLRRHRGVGAKQCVCHLCGASFQGNSKLNRHLRSVCEKNKLEEELSVFYNQDGSI